MKTIIASMDQKDAIMRDLASKNDGILKDIQVQSLNTLLKEEKDDSIVLSMQLSSSLKEKKEQFPIYQAMFSYPAFITEILSFTKECILYGIHSNELPETNANEKELKTNHSDCFEFGSSGKEKHSKERRSITKS